MTIGIFKVRKNTKSSKLNTTEVDTLISIEQKVRDKKEFSVLATRSQPYNLGEIISAALNTQLTSNEINFILDHRPWFIVKIRLGDRRTDNSTLRSRIGGLVTLQEGEKTIEMIGANKYDFKITVTKKQVTVTDNHASTPNTYGAIRGLDIYYSEGFFKQLLL